MPVVRRRRKRKGGFLFGTVLGAAVGVAGGMAYLKRPASSDETPRAAAPLADAAGTATETAQRAQAQVTQRATGALDALKERWNLAMQEGKAAADARRRELEAQYAEETKRVDAPEPPAQNR